MILIVVLVSNLLMAFPKVEPISNGEKLKSENEMIRNLYDQISHHIQNIARERRLNMKSHQLTFQTVSNLSQQLFPKQVVTQSTLT